MQSSIYIRLTVGEGKTAKRNRTRRMSCSVDRAVEQSEINNATLRVFCCHDIDCILTLNYNIKHSVLKETMLTWHYYELQY